ncbi:MAG: hypothetical protein ABIG96_06070 [Candidatus Micrarchaeota archaeon]
MNKGRRTGIGSSSSISIFKYLLLAAIVLSASMFVLNAQKKPERFSQLSLIAGAFPSEVEAGTKFNFGLEIYNHEGKGMLYEYRVLVDGAEIGSNKIILDDGEKKRIYEPVMLNDKGIHKVQIEMNAEGKAYGVFFKVDII